MASVKSKDETVHPAIEEAQHESVGPVQPIQVVRNKPEDGSEESEVVMVHNKPNLQETGSVLEAAHEPTTPEEEQNQVYNCWNCANHKRKTELDQDGNCDTCGFKRNDLYNGTIEAEKSRKRQMFA